MHSDTRRMTPGALLLLLLRCSASLAAAPTSLYWNTSNPIFRQEEVVLEVNRDNHPWQYDQVNLICPSGGNTSEQHIVYIVTRAEWESCQLSSGKPRILAICDQPSNFMYFTITFRSFSPSPQQMEFKPGESYYLVSTAREDDLHSTQGGWCKSHNMRLVFRVASSRLESSPPQRPLFWSQYWGGRAPRPRDAYRREDEEYGEPWREGGNALKLRSAGGREGGSWLALVLAVLGRGLL